MFKMIPIMNGFVKDNATYVHVSTFQMPHRTVPFTLSSDLNDLALEPVSNDSRFAS